MSGPPEHQPPHHPPPRGGGMGSELASIFARRRLTGEGAMAPGIALKTDGSSGTAESSSPSVPPELRSCGSSVGEGSSGSAGAEDAASLTETAETPNALHRQQVALTPPRPPSSKKIGNASASWIRRTASPFNDEPIEGPLRDRESASGAAAVAEKLQKDSGSKPLPPAVPSPLPPKSMQSKQIGDNASWITRMALTCDDMHGDGNPCTLDSAEPDGALPIEEFTVDPQRDTLLSRTVRSNAKGNTSWIKEAVVSSVENQQGGGNSAETAEAASGGVSMVSLPQQRSAQSLVKREGAASWTKQRAPVSARDKNSDGTSEVESTEKAVATVIVSRESKPPAKVAPMLQRPVSSTKRRKDAASWIRKNAHSPENDENDCGEDSQTEAVEESVVSSAEETPDGGKLQSQTVTPPTRLLPSAMKGKSTASWTRRAAKFSDHETVSSEMSESETIASKESRCLSQDSLTPPRPAQLSEKGSNPSSTRTSRTAGSCGDRQSDPDSAVAKGSGSKSFANSTPWLPVLESSKKTKNGPASRTKRAPPSHGGEDDENDLLALATVPKESSKPLHENSPSAPSAQFDRIASKEPSWTRRKLPASPGTKDVGDADSATNAAALPVHRNVKSDTGVRIPTWATAVPAVKSSREEHIPSKGGGGSCHNDPSAIICLSTVDMTVKQPFKATPAQPRHVSASINKRNDASSWILRDSSDESEIERAVATEEPTTVETTVAIEEDTRKGIRYNLMPTSANKIIGAITHSDTDAGKSSATLQMGIPGHHCTLSSPQPGSSTEDEAEKSTSNTTSHEKHNSQAPQRGSCSNAAGVASILAIARQSFHSPPGRFSSTLGTTSSSSPVTVAHLSQRKGRIKKSATESVSDGTPLSCGLTNVGKAARFTTPPAATPSRPASVLSATSSISRCSSAPDTSSIRSNGTARVGIAPLHTLLSSSAGVGVCSSSEDGPSPRSKLLLRKPEPSPPCIVMAPIPTEGSFSEPARDDGGDSSKTTKTAAGAHAASPSAPKSPHTKLWLSSRARNLAKDRAGRKALAANRSADGGVSMFKFENSPLPAVPSNGVGPTASLAKTSRLHESMRSSKVKKLVLSRRSNNGIGGSRVKGDEIRPSSHNFPTPSSATCDIPSEACNKRGNDKLVVDSKACGIANRGAHKLSVLDGGEILCRDIAMGSIACASTTASSTVSAVVLGGPSDKMEKRTDRYMTNESSVRNANASIVLSSNEVLHQARQSLRSSPRHSGVTVPSKKNFEGTRKVLGDSLLGKNSAVEGGSSSAPPLTSVQISSRGSKRPEPGKIRLPTSLLTNSGASGVNKMEPQLTTSKDAPPNSVAPPVRLPPRPSNHCPSSWQKHSAPAGRKPTAAVHQKCAPSGALGHHMRSLSVASIDSITCEIRQRDSLPTNVPLNSPVEEIDLDADAIISKDTGEKKVHPDKKTEKCCVKRAASMKTEDIPSSIGVKNAAPSTPTITESTSRKINSSAPFVVTNSPLGSTVGSSRGVAAINSPLKAYGTAPPQCSIPSSFSSPGVFFSSTSITMTPDRNSAFSQTKLLHSSPGFGSDFPRSAFVPSPGFIPPSARSDTHGGCDNSGISPGILLPAFSGSSCKGQSSPSPCTVEDDMKMVQKKLQNYHVDMNERDKTIEDLRMCNIGTGEEAGNKRLSDTNCQASGQRTRHEIQPNAHQLSKSYLRVSGSGRRFLC